MNKRIIYIGSPAILKTKDSQLQITNIETGEINTVPIVDIGVLELDNPQITITAYTLRFLMENKGVMLINDFYHNPSGLMYPIAASSVQVERLNLQVKSTQKHKNKLWKNIVEQKITNQARLIDYAGGKNAKLLRYAENINDGDQSNKEGAAAAYYWKELFLKEKFGKNFKREQQGDYPNMFLNYGYTVLRSLFTREIAASGLAPALGIFHKNKYNNFCLADDLMEPYRPYIDKRVLQFVRKTEDEYMILEREHKKMLLEVLFEIVTINGQSKQIMNAVSDTVYSYIKAIKEKSDNILYPLL